MPSVSVLKSGCQALDEALGGGLRARDIVQIYGPSGVGKTTLALQFSIMAAHQNYRVVFIDAENALSLIRLRQLASKDFDQIASLISIVSPSTFDEQNNLIKQLDTIISTRVRLLIIDTVVSLYRKKLGELEENIVLNRLLNRQLGVITSLTKTRPLTVILVNQVRGYDESPDGFLPVASSIISYWCTNNIQIKKSESMGYREFKLTKRNENQAKEFVAELGLSGFK